MRYEFYYWPAIQGRGEFVRLALEEAGADYVDVARGQDGSSLGREPVLRLVNGEDVERPPFAPPFLKAGKQIIGQTANILFFLGSRHGLAPKSEAGRLWASQLQMTVTDFVKEIHDTHHPIANSLYYEEQKPEAKRKSADFLKNRAPKYFGYFERVLQRNPSSDMHLIGGRISYPDLSVFQLVAGMRYAFPKAMAKLEPDIPRVVALYDAVARRPRITAYLESPRRIPFNEMGVFRRYKELDAIR
jgi:glutathione S-transferase